MFVDVETMAQSISSEPEMVGNYIESQMEAWARNGETLNSSTDAAVQSEMYGAHTQTSTKPNTCAARRPHQIRTGVLPRDTLLL